MMEKTIMYNAAIFPYTMSFAFQPKDNESEGCSIDLPRGVYQLYLSQLNYNYNRREIELFEKYANGIKLSDEEYSEIIDYAFISTPRTTSIPNDLREGLLAHFGVKLDLDGKTPTLRLLPEAKEEIRSETWDYIIIDLLKKHTDEVIECFDFEKTYTRTDDDPSPLRFYLGAYKFSTDQAEQKLSNALRSAFFFTLAGYKYNIRVSQYQCFEDYFDNEFYKRVSLLYAIWCNRTKPEDVRYIALYDSFSNLTNENKTNLINVLKEILDSDFLASDDKETLKNQLIAGCAEVHLDPNAQILEQTLIKPAMNFIMLRDKYKETMESAIQLYNEKHYKDCANRCYYAMMFALKALLEDQGKLSDWKVGELKESETHGQLENKLSDLVSAGVMDQVFQKDFADVKDIRWACDYSIMTFVEADARDCIQKMKSFCDEVERLTVH